MSDTTADDIKAAIGDILSVADPTSKLVVSAYSHVARHSINVKALSSSKFKSEQLELCANFLRLQTRDDHNQSIYTNKASLADRIVTKIESHFPSTCHDCSEEYQVKHSHEQSRRLQCFLCLQLSHDCEAITQDTQATTKITHWHQIAATDPKVLYSTLMEHHLLNHQLHLRVTSIYQQ